MDSDICHVILTRFNMRTGGREVAIRSSPGWLERRFELFERYCLPAVAAQTFQDFQWIIFFDEASPQWVWERIAELQKIRHFHVNASPLFNADGWGQATRQVLGGGAHPQLLVTTNLDNDDGLSIDYMQRLNECVRKNRIIETPFAINFLNGVISSNGYVYHIKHKRCAFVNVVERFGPDITTCNVYQHMFLNQHMRVIQEDRHSAWYQIVHGANVSNKIRGRLFSPDDLGDLPFTFEEQLKTPSKAQILIDNMVLNPVRVVRDQLANAKNAIKNAVLG